MHRRAHLVVVVATGHPVVQGAVQRCKAMAWWWNLACMSIQVQIRLLFQTIATANTTNVCFLSLLCNRAHPRQEKHHQNCHHRREKAEGSAVLEASKTRAENIGKFIYSLRLVWLEKWLEQHNSEDAQPTPYLRRMAQFQRFIPPAGRRLTYHVVFSHAPHTRRRVTYVYVSSVTSIVSHRELFMHLHMCCSIFTGDSRSTVAILPGHHAWSPSRTTS